MVFCFERNDDEALAFEMFVDFLAEMLVEYSSEYHEDEEEVA